MKQYKFCACIGVLLAFSQAVAQTAQQKQETRAKNAGDGALSATTAKLAPPRSGSAVPKLPVRRVVLYKNGVGYFEHLGEVHGSESIRIDFTSGQLNDVLKSLTILDLNGGRVTAVDYNSEAPLGQLLGALRLPLGEKTSVAEFLGALRGARLEVRSGATTIAGRLLSVERKTRVSGGTTLEVEVISLVTDFGEVRELELTPAVSVRLMDSDLNHEVGRYLTLLASERDQDLRRMVISTAGKGERKLYVSYISEVPVWKTTYRIVLSSKPDNKPLLQGWAIVDNTVGEDWNDVQLSLVAGSPQSFIMQLSQPYYSRRPSVSLPLSAQFSPQTHEGTMRAGFAKIAGTVTDPSNAAVPAAQVRLFTNLGQLVASGKTDAAGRYEIVDLPSGEFQLEIESPGFPKVMVQNVALSSASETKQDVVLPLGSATTTVEVKAVAGGTVNTESESLSPNAARTVGSGRALGSGRAVGGSGEGGGAAAGYGWGTGGGVPGVSPAQARQSLEAAAFGRELGDLFEYRVKEPVTIHQNQSALVPIVQTNVDVERVSLWNPSLSSPRPLRALWLTNSSPLTLDGGSFSILEDDTFAGEGLMNLVKPGEKRLLSYAVDPGVRVDTKLESERQRVRHVKIVRGVMTQTSELRERKTYTIRNEDGSPRTVVIEHPVRPEWKIATDALKPDEASADYYRFRIVVEPKSTATLTVPEVKLLDQQYQIINVSTDQIALFLQQGSVSPEVEQGLRRIVEQNARIGALDQELSKRKEETDSIYDDQQRLRENIKSLKGGPEERSLTQRYVQLLNDQETRLEALRREVADFQSKRQEAQARLERMIEQMSFDVML